MDHNPFPKSIELAEGIERGTQDPGALPQTKLTWNPQKGRAIKIAVPFKGATWSMGFPKPLNP